MRRIVGTVGVGLALILPAVAASQQKSDDIAAATSSQTHGCSVEGKRQLAAVNQEYVWRLSAFEDLDCALAILDEALRAKGGVITLSRQQAEQARARVWAARDAAARIGR